MPDLITLFLDPATWAALVTLIAMKVVLGIDNLVFISILTNKLEDDVRPRARKIGLSLALILRIVLLSFIAFIVSLTRPVIELLGHGFSWRDIILIAGGLFLVWKATTEIHQSVDPEGEDHYSGIESAAPAAARIGFGSAIAQIIVLDIVFSIDSIVTAVGMTSHVPIMVVAVIVAVGVMMTASGPLARFIERNPTIVMLALGFLLMIGMTLIADGFGYHVPKGYIYAAMAFSAGVETLNTWARKARSKRTPH